MSQLTNKHILFLCPNFFGYEIDIKKTMELLGAHVYAFDDRPKNDVFTKALIRLNRRRLIAKKIDDYYSEILKKVSDFPIDAIFLVNPETIDKQKLSNFKEAFPGARVLIYLWDSIENKPSVKALLPLANHCFSFDNRDVSYYKNMSFLPLFYVSDYGELVLSDAGKHEGCDVSFIGTIHSDRYKIIREIQRQVEADGRIMFSYFYCPSRMVFLYRKYVTRELAEVDGRQVRYQPLSRRDVLGIIAKSKAVIDIEHIQQRGLTMRTIEMLGAQKKLITTNSSICDYDFYVSGNVHIIDRNHPLVQLDFLDGQYSALPKPLYFKYSLRNWVCQIFSLKEWS